VIAREAMSVRLLALPFRFFVGGRLGSGRQWFPWVHLDDVVAVYRHALDEGGLSGSVNLVAPGLVRQGDAAREVGRALHRPSVLPAPAFALRLILGEQADLLLHGQRAESEKLAGFPFRYPELGPALESALGSSS
jgi:NAD dependent epimerase/dehydratase family enzyme